MSNLQALHSEAALFCGDGVVTPAITVLSAGEACPWRPPLWSPTSCRSRWSLPCLLLSYFGQGALVIANPKAVSNPFYVIAPQWALTPLVVLATVAAIIASQAVRRDVG